MEMILPGEIKTLKNKNKIKKRHTKKDLSNSKISIRTAREIIEHVQVDQICLVEAPRGFSQGHINKENSSKDNIFPSLQAFF